jgi:hypothetical protein
LGWELSHREFAWHNSSRSFATIEFIFFAIARILITRSHLLASYQSTSRLWRSHRPTSIGSYALDRRSVIRSCTSISALGERRLLRICSCCKIGSELRRAYHSCFVSFCRLIMLLRRHKGAYHNVVRWVHRSLFTIRPPTRKYAPPPPNSRGQTQVPRIPILETENMFVDLGWYGTIVVETEGTKETLADLQERCGPGVFPSPPRGVNGHHPTAQFENRKVFRILREKRYPFYRPLSFNQFE